MRKMRAKIAISLCIVVFATSVGSVVVTWLIRSDVLDSENIRVLLFGLALKDVLLILMAAAAAATMIAIVSRRTANPILELTQAAREIERGNFAVQLHFRSRTRELAELEKSFNSMAKELHSNEYLRRDFMANVSHEIKTPLTVIQGYAQLAADESLDPAQRTEYARLIIQETQRLVRVSGNMLRLARIESRGATPRRLEFSLAEQIRQAVLRLESRWSSREQELSLELEELTYAGDEELLAEVWLNLLDNAVKFTPHGGSISVTLRQQERAAVATVSDTGCGMDEQALEHVFEQFYQADPSHRQEGSGLGLALVKRIAEFHGGSVSAESTPGGGTRMTVTLPLPEDTARHSRREERQHRRAQRQQRRGENAG